MKSIGIIGEYDESFAPHPATNAAIEHSCAALDIQVGFDWVSTADLDESFFNRFQGLWVAPGSPYKDMAKTLEVIRFAREHRVPAFGTCGGFQHLVIEYARNVLGITDAHHAEYDPYASCLFVTELECSLAGREMKVHLSAGSMASEIYGAGEAVERYYCNFAINRDFLDVFESGPLNVTGFDSEGEARIVELPGHPFFLGTLFVPQAQSSPAQPHPLVNGFIQSIERC